MTESTHLRSVVARLSRQAALPALIFPYGLWRLFERQDHSWDALILTLGPLATWAGVMLYRSTRFAARTERSWSLSFRVLSGFLPWAFMCYLFFYKGLWGLISLWGDFSVRSLAGSLLFAWLGFGSAKAMENLSSKELADACAGEAA